MGISFFVGFIWLRFSVPTETGLGVFCLLILFFCLHLRNVSLHAWRDGGKHTVQAELVVGRNLGDQVRKDLGCLSVLSGLVSAWDCHSTHLQRRVCATARKGGKCLCRSSPLTSVHKIPGLCISSNLVFYSHLVNGVSDFLLLVQLLLLPLLVTTSHTWTIFSTMQS